MRTLDELLEALAVAPNDIRLLQKAGELFQKRGDNKSAATYFARVAECYARDGYQLEAVALFKQVLKLDPELIDLLARLASIHAGLQLNREANEYLLKARDAFLRAGRRDDAREMERQLLERSVTFDTKLIARA